MGINGEPDDSSSFVVPANAVDGLDEIAKRQELLIVIGLHLTTIRRVALRLLWGLDPMKV